MTKTKLPTEVVWQEFFASKGTGREGCPKIKNKLIETYYGLVRIVAQKMYQKNNQLTVDEFMSMGVDGLYDAIDGYDPDKFKNKFETYAMHRIRGSMLDEVRKSDWVPRLVRSNVTKLEKKRQIFESQAGKKLTSNELAEKMEISVEDFECLVRGATTTAMHSVDEARSINDDRKSFAIEHIQDNKAVQPIERLLRQELFNKLLGKNFTPQERKIMWLYYFEDLSMKEISSIVSLSESRVSQRHGEIRARLQKKADRNPEYFTDIWSMISGFKDATVA